jgi:hypothetical protein
MLSPHADGAILRTQCVRLTTSASPATQQGNNEKHQEYEEQYLRYSRSACSDPAEAEHRSDQRDNEKRDSVMQHRNSF